MHFSGNSVTYLSLLIKWPLKRNAMLKSFFFHIFDKWTFIRCKTNRNINNLFVFCPSKTHYKNKHFWSKYRENGSQCLLKRKIVHLRDFFGKKLISEKFRLLASIWHQICIGTINLKIGWSCPVLLGIVHRL